MELIDPIVFATEVLVGKEQFVKIAEIIRKYEGHDAAERFIKAYENVDVKTTEAMIDQLVIHLTGIQNTTDALYHFVEKFPNLNPELYGIIAAESYEYRKVTAIDGFYDRMKQIMEAR